MVIDMNDAKLTTLVQLKAYQGIIDTITQALLLNPGRQIEKKRDNHQIEAVVGDLDEAATAEANVTRKLDEAVEREKASRSIFAQNVIKAQDIKVDRATGIPKIIRAMRETGSPPAEFEFDDDHSYFSVRLPVHPAALEVAVSARGGGAPCRQDRKGGQSRG